MKVVEAKRQLPLNNAVDHPKSEEVTVVESKCENGFQREVQGNESIKRSK